VLNSSAHLSRREETESAVRDSAPRKGQLGLVSLSFAYSLFQAQPLLTGHFLAKNYVSLKWRQEIPPASQPMRPDILARICRVETRALH
jgi:hypothetical protein